MKIKIVITGATGMIEGVESKNTLIVYKIFNPLLKIVKVVFPNYVCSLNEIGRAMINSVIRGYDKNILEVADIKNLGRS